MCLVVPVSPVTQYQAVKLNNGVHPSVTLIIEILRDKKEYHSLLVLHPNLRTCPSKVGHARAAAQRLRGFGTTNGRFFCACM